MSGTDPQKGPEPKDLKSLLFDLQKEIDGDDLEGVFEIDGRSYRMRLLNTEEMNWVLGFAKGPGLVAIGSSLRLPTVAMAVRSIDGVALADVYANDWEELSGADLERFNAMNKYAQKYFVAENFMDFLSQRPADFVEKLNAKYSELDQRRRDAQEALKNSSGEGSETAEKPSTTESSPTGD